MSKLVDFPFILFAVSLVTLWLSAHVGDFLGVQWPRRGDRVQRAEQPDIGQRTDHHQDRCGHDDFHAALEIRESGFTIVGHGDHAALEAVLTARDDIRPTAVVADIPEGEW